MKRSFESGSSKLKKKKKFQELLDKTSKLTSFYKPSPTTASENLSLCSSDVNSSSALDQNRNYYSI